MKQDIVKRKYWSDKHCRPGEGSVVLTLKCGHQKFMKMSAEPKYYCLCRECDNSDNNPPVQVGRAEACGCDGYYQLFSIHRPGCIHALD